MISKKANLSENLEMAFLRDVQVCPDSGIAARYKRLGLSVRQGQKLKAAMLEKGLICQQMETNSNGRVRVTKLADKAKSLF